MPEPELPPSTPPARRATRGGRMTGITQARAPEEPAAPPPDWLREESRSPEPPEPEPVAEAGEVAEEEAIPAALSAEERRAWVQARTRQLWIERRSAAAEQAPPRADVPARREQLAAPSWLAPLARGALLLAVGVGLGYGVARWIGPAPAPAAADSSTSTPATKPSLAAPEAFLDPSSPAAAEMEREMDLAYAAMKAKRHAEARGRFAALRLRFPGQATFAVEEARCFYYLGDHAAAQRTLSENIAVGRALAESHFLMGLVQLAGKNYELAQDSFRRSALADPSRPETHFLWAEGLRREGRGAEAAHRYQIAWERNQFETNEVAYRLKLWLAQITGGGMPEESARQLDAALAAKPPAGEALVADAARALQASDFARAARRLEEARRTMEPLIFQIALRDPAFVQEAWRPEIAPFYERRP